MPQDPPLSDVFEVCKGGLKAPDTQHDGDGNQKDGGFGMAVHRLSPRWRSDMAKNYPTEHFAIIKPKQHPPPADDNGM
jgi:hypothetical protein